MSAPPYMKLYIADYLADTTHLSRGEHGAYLLLLMAMWRAGGKLPNNDAKLAAIAKCSPDEWADLRPVLIDFFKGSGGNIKHKRLSRELSHYGEVVKKRKIASDSRKAKKDNELADPFDDHLTTKPEPEPEPEPIERIDTTTTIAPAGDWKSMFDQAKAAAGDAANLTRPNMHHIADLRALVEPNSGEPCTWPEVLDAIAMTAMRQRAKGRLIDAWSWVAADALALRDKRLNAANPDVISLANRQSPHSFGDRIGAEKAEAHRIAFEQMDAANG